MEVRELICIGCPLGCPLTVKMDGDQIEVTGNTCKRGDDYARKEVLSPNQNRYFQCSRIRWYNRDGVGKD